MVLALLPNPPPPPPASEGYVPLVGIAAPSPTPAFPKFPPLPPSYIVDGDLPPFPPSPPMASCMMGSASAPPDPGLPPLTLYIPNNVSPPLLPGFPTTAPFPPSFAAAVPPDPPTPTEYDHVSPGLVVIENLVQAPPPPPPPPTTLFASRMADPPPPPPAPINVTVKSYVPDGVVHSPDPLVKTTLPIRVHSSVWIR